MANIKMADGWGQHYSQPIKLLINTDRMDGI